MGFDLHLYSSLSICTESVRRISWLAYRLFPRTLGTVPCVSETKVAALLCILDLILSIKHPFWLLRQVKLRDSVSFRQVTLVASRKTREDGSQVL